MRRARSRRSIVLMATGVMTTNSLAAAEQLAKDGHDVSVVHFHTIKPLDEEAVLEFSRDAELVATVEEGTVIGGFGSAVTDLLVEKLGVSLPPMLRIGLAGRLPAQIWRCRKSCSRSMVWRRIKSPIGSLNH